MSLYRVDKDAVPVNLYLTDGSRLAGSVFLSEFSGTRSGAQTIEELMAEPAPLLPFTTEDGRFLLVGKACVAAVETPSEASPVSGYWTRIAARLRLSGGHAVEGSLLTQEGPGIRFSDAVNAAAPWLVVEGERSRFWVARASLLLAEERPQPPP